MGKSMKRILWVLLMPLLLSSQTSCRPANPIDKAPAVGSSPPTEAVPSPVESEGVAAATNGTTICFVYGQIIQSGPAYLEGAKHAESAIAGQTLRFTGPSAYKNEPFAQQQIEILQNLVVEKVDAIIIAPVDSALLAEPIAEAFRAGIPIIVVDSKIDTDAYTARFYTDNVKAGRAAAEELLKNMRANGVSDGEKAQVVILISGMTAQPILDRLQGFTDYWCENAPELWEILSDDIKMGDGDSRIAIDLGMDAIDAYPDLKGMFALNSTGAVGLVIALEETGRTDIAMVGFGLSAEIQMLIRGGSYSVSTLLPRRYYMGYDAVKLAYDILQGETPPTEKQVDTGVLVVTRENIDGTEPDLIHNGY